ncbi:MAG TPA: patatin-like phospholipase family protein [Thermoanaerobaculia bacterium]|nr:patatin-like phospholipase family protein [Thermoanaerobaculia bacterium]
MSAPPPSAAPKAAVPAPVPSVPPPRHCDVIMKGGITSGVVYPAAGVALARRYTLRSIGGASAGAIAAALFAAAEFRRSARGSSAGFDELATYPATFGSTTPSGTSFLLALVRPAPDARRLFRLLLAFLGPDRWRKALRVAGTALVQYAGAFVIGLVPAAALVIYASRASDSLVTRLVVLLLSLLPLLLGITVPFVVAVFLDLVRATTRHGFGICTGQGDPAAPGDPPPLTDWLETRLDAVAFGNDRGGDRPDGYAPEDPLTFADLWGAPTEDDRRRLEVDAGGRRINLEVMTTNLTQGRPYRLPFESDRLFFDPAELGRLFSPRIVEFMKRHRRRSSDHDPRLTAIAEQKGLVPLPRAGDIPVVVAVRMSLSFPVLVSAVPLWGFDFSWAAKDASGAPGEPRLTRCWFTDGGITSNFPIHFFDGPIPRWPTFAFDLTPFHPRFAYDPKDETKNVWLPSTNGDGLTEVWSNPPEGGRASELFWFLARIVDTMQNWRDNIQLKVPGYRDRVAQIHLRDEEGGINLTMPPELIAALSERGGYAASVLAERFSDQPPSGTILTWDNHCWVRLRSMMSLLEQNVAKIERAFSQREGTKTYGALEERPPSYRFADSASARAMLAELDALAAGWAQKPGSFGANAPKPAPELRVMPRV